MRTPPPAARPATAAPGGTTPGVVARDSGSGADLRVWSWIRWRWPRSAESLVGSEMRSLLCGRGGLRLGRRWAACKILWVSRALPGRTHDLTAARRHRIIATCVRLGTPVLADLGYVGAGGTFAVPHRRRPRQDLAVGQRSINRAHARLRYPVERGIARLKTWKIFRHARCSPTWLTQAAKAGAPKRITKVSSPNRP